MSDADSPVPHAKSRVMRAALTLRRHLTDEVKYNAGEIRLAVVGALSELAKKSHARANHGDDSGSFDTHHQAMQRQMALIRHVESATTTPPRAERVEELDVRQLRGDILNSIRLNGMAATEATLEEAIQSRLRTQAPQTVSSGAALAPY